MAHGLQPGGWHGPIIEAECSGPHLLAGVAGEAPRVGGATALVAAHVQRLLCADHHCAPLIYGAAELLFAAALRTRVWAGLAGLSYSAYRTPAYTESGLLLTIEYGVVLAWAAAEYYMGHAKRPPATARRLLPGARAK
jgi:hypothetical protein